jgi:hypothetical protein
MADDVTVLDAAAVSRAMSAKELTSPSTKWLQRFQPAMHSGGAAVDVDLTNPLPVRRVDALVHPIIIAASANAVRIKSVAGKVKSVHIFNAGLTTFHAKIHDSTANPPVAGTTAVSFPVSCGAGQQRDFIIPENGFAFAAGLGVTTTLGAANADATILTSDFVGSTIVVTYV